MWPVSSTPTTIGRYSRRKHSNVKAIEGDLEKFRDQLATLRSEKRQEVPLNVQFNRRSNDKRVQESKLERARHELEGIDQQIMLLVEKKSDVQKRPDEQDAKLQVINKGIQNIAVQVAKDAEGQGAASRTGGEGPQGGKKEEPPSQGRTRACVQGQESRDDLQNHVGTDSDDGLGLGETRVLQCTAREEVVAAAAAAEQ